MSEHDTPAVRVASRRDGFRRAGMAHPLGPVEHPAGTFSPEQLEALMRDPMLIVDTFDDGAQEEFEAALQQALDGLNPEKKPAGVAHLNAADRDAAWEAWQAAKAAS